MRGSSSYVARPVGNGPFGVVLQRTPYTRILHPAGRYWASRGYIFVAQHVRGRDISDGNDFGDYDTDVRDGYDAVEWAAKLPGANGNVGLIGHSDEGRLAWYAAVSAPPHLAAIAPSAATADPWRIAPYEDMVLSPINVDWACLMRGRTLQNTSELDIGTAHHAPAAHRSPATTRLRRRDAVGPLARASDRSTPYWRAHAVTTNIAKVRAPVLQISGWYDDSRGPIDYTNALAEGAGTSVHSSRHGPGRAQRRRLRGRRVRSAVARRDATSPAPLVRSLSARQGQRRRHRAAVRRLRVRRQHVAERSRVADRARRADQVVRASGGSANTSAGDGVLDTIPPTGAPADTFTYDPANPTPYLIDSRELETSLNEDFAPLNAVAARRARVHVEAAHASRSK